MKKFTKYIGLDVHKNTITVAVAEPTGVPQIWGTVENTPLAVGCFRHRVLLRRQLHSPIVHDDEAHQVGEHRRGLLRCQKNHSR